MIERFWAKVDVSGVHPEAKIWNDEPCWIWLAARDRAGYGNFHLPRNGKPYMDKASRVSLSLALGRELFPGMCSLHHCDNPPCVRPSHLFEGTRGDNSLDASLKGRSHKPRYGLNPHTRLDVEKVLRIRALFDDGMRQVELAKMFGVAQTAVSKIVNRQTWSYV